MDKNKYHCKTKVNHVCRECSNLIVKGSKVLTVNPRFGNRYWICNACENSKLSEERHFDALDTVGFEMLQESGCKGDEGNWLVG